MGLYPLLVDIVEAAKLLRRELAQTFPSVKFSVRIDRYSVGESINVHWFDGPADSRVDPILRKYEEIEDRSLWLT